MLDACIFFDIRNKEFSEISYKLEADVADIQSFKIVIFFHTFSTYPEINLILIDTETYA